MAVQVLSTKELADELKTDARTLRKFLRAVTPKDDQPGKGSRWSIEKRQLRSLRKQFSEWQAAKETEAEATDAAADIVEEDEDLDA